MTELTFSEHVEAGHRRVRTENWSDIYVVGDVHGCPDELVSLVDALGVTDEDLVILVGDLVRKGPDSKAVIDAVRARDNFLSVRGNNEQKLRRGADTIPALTDDDLAWLASLPLAISFDDALVVHGGIDHTRPLDEHTPGDLMTMRSTSGGADGRPYWFETRTESPRVLFGHTVLERPLVTEWAVGLDTGCVHGRALTAYDWRAGVVRSVPADEVYEPRSPADVLSPRAPRTTAP